MKKYLILFFTLKTFLIFGQIPPNDPNWEIDLTLSDEFTTLDLSKWRVANNCDHGGEPQVYLTDNVSVSGGNLVIEAKAEMYGGCPGPINCWSCGGCSGVKNITSGWVETTNDFHYGYIEARINNPFASESWPAFWTYNGNTIVPYLDQGNEIDIFEMNGEKSVTNMGTNIHRVYCSTTYTCPGDGTQDCPANGCNGKNINLPYSYPNTFRKYAIEWSSSRITWYYDDVAVRTDNNPGIFDPARIIFNLAFNKGSTPVLSTPIYMYVDYIRFYKLKQDCDGIINTCIYDFASHDNTLKNDITIGGAGCSNSVSSGSSTYLRASNFVDLSGDFTVPIGATFYADANNGRECSNPPPTENCGYIFNPCNYNFLGYDNNVKKQITLGGGSCNSSIMAGSTILLDATESITLLPGFTIESGANVTVEIVPCP